MCHVRLFYSPNLSAVKTEGLLAPPSLCTTFLPPIVKGEVLSPKKIRATTGGIVTLTFAPHPTLPNPYYPSKIANTLATLVKGEVLSPEKIRATTRGIVTPPIATPPTLPNPYYPSKIANTLASLVKGEVLSPEKIRATTGGIVTLTLALHQPFPNPHYHPRFSWCEFDSPTYRKNKIRPRFHGGELIKSLIYKY